jgi:hypothetical protein
VQSLSTITPDPRLNLRLRVICWSLPAAFAVIVNNWIMTD